MKNHKGPKIVCLYVYGNISFNEQNKQITIMPDLIQLKIKKMLLRGVIVEILSGESIVEV